jgi:hypothetical protein
MCGILLRFFGADNDKHCQRAHRSVTRHDVCQVFVPVQIRLALETKENVMGKYFLGWLLGVPAIVLVVLWFFFR